MLLLECALIGEPLRIELARLANGCLGRGGPIIFIVGLFADRGLRSCGGESPKHSPKDIDVEVESLLLPAANLNLGS